MSTAPPDLLDRVRTLPAFVDQPVPDDVIDENGHMNITAYFREGAWALWARLRELGMSEHYITERDRSFFTVEHHIRYLGELRRGEPYSVRSGLAGRTAKALHGVVWFVDEEHDRLACEMEIMYVHVSMSTRRSDPMPADLASAMDVDIAAHPWLAGFATGLQLRR